MNSTLLSHHVVKRYRQRKGLDSNMKDIQLNIKPVNNELASVPSKLDLPPGDMTQF